MSKIICNVKGKFARMERGQVLVLVALAAIGIIAIVGLVMDAGLMFIGNARLRRAVDSAALSAALQYTKANSDLSDPGKLTGILTRSANEYLVMNGFDNPDSQVYDCENSPGDHTLCMTPPRKLVRVHATVDVPLAFLPVIGIDKVTISATAVAEAASVDVVLVIDRSESMTYGKDLANQLPQTDPMVDPSWCNTQAPTDGSGDFGSCQPFDSVINAAVAFTQILFFPYDEVAVVTFDKEPHTELTLDGICRNKNIPCTPDNILKNLTVFEGDESVDPTGDAASYPKGNPSRCYGGDCEQPQDHLPNQSNYEGLGCPQVDTGTGDPSTCTTTNIGGGLRLAGNEFTKDKRPNSLWVVILLTDGVANAGHTEGTNLLYFCPQDTWVLLPRCNWGDPTTRLSAPLSGPFALDYDASDYAYDMADFVGLPYNSNPNVHSGQDALIYTIGLGPLVDYYNQASYVDPYNTDLIHYPTSRNEGLGRIFLNYAAYGATKGRGQAFYAARTSDLNDIFTLIANNIATRLSQ